LDLLDGAEDHRRGALNRPAHQVPWAVAVTYLGESLPGRHNLAVRAGCHVAVGQARWKAIWRRLGLQAQDVGKSAFARAVEVRAGEVRVCRTAGSISSPRGAEVAARVTAGWETSGRRRTSPGRRRRHHRRLLDDLRDDGGLGTAAGRGHARPGNMAELGR
jgi:hypothetical protein